MLTVTATRRVFLATQPTDMRKSFNGLIKTIRAELGDDPLSGDVFCFLNKRATLLKIIAFVGDGYLIVYKRIERSTFPTARSQPGRRIRISPAQLTLLIAAIDFNAVPPRHSPLPYSRRI